ncbi:hypothetical protein F5J12DRAFT_839977 [Pisolithus orientalis]|uniref:uncharacterized protein n=1 Tax=Pisolithus orientalis TaxID=936130 RepID=UPI002224B7E1|nr:uncharacterized protein F5J12DRAFT_839977 [Pisolithus orientalis]KAI6002579.1 hypothetical protein F5J12DRAFT_839977 [Pisolithus orientalis]
MLCKREHCRKALRCAAPTLRSSVHAQYWTWMAHNQTGVNGYGVKQYPPEDVLREALHQYAKERLTFQLTVKKSRLHELNKQCDGPSPRKPPPTDIATQAVLEKVANDVNQANGVRTITSLSSSEGMPLPRCDPYMSYKHSLCIYLSSDFVRTVLACHAPDGLNARFPRGKQVGRSTLSAIGPNHQHHADGFAKLNAQALQMGGVGLDIYGIKDQWSSFLLHLVVVPNHRLAATIGHVHLDYITKYMGYFVLNIDVEAIPPTFVTDRGSETGIIFANQTALCTVFAPNIDANQYPPFQFLKSVHNTPIEGLWHWFLDTKGINVKILLRSGLHDGAYHPNKSLHKQLFYWLWPKILRGELDSFVEYWNNHRIRYQKRKSNASGTSPRHAFTLPASQGGQDCKVPVTQDVIDALRHEIPVSRDVSMCWVSEEFGNLAERIYEEIGCPNFTLHGGWAIFQQMEEILVDELQVDELLYPYLR